MAQNSHFTPSLIIRPASGKKKKYMIMKQATTENIIIHRINAVSNFKCMKYPIISADLITERISKTSSIRTGFEYLAIGQHHFDSSQNQQRSPHPKILPLAVIMRRGIVHSWFPLCASVSPVVNCLKRS